MTVRTFHCLDYKKEEKIPLYSKILKALKPEGFFILTDYFALSEEEEQFYQAELLRLKSEQNIPDNEFYHYDTPLTIEHETKTLSVAGFSKIMLLKNWGQTSVLKAIR